jgi:hypothetical protein
LDLTQESALYPVAIKADGYSMIKPTDEAKAVFSFIPLTTNSPVGMVPCRSIGKNFFL